MLRCKPTFVEIHSIQLLYNVVFDEENRCSCSEKYCCSENHYVLDGLINRNVSVM